MILIVGLIKKNILSSNILNTRGILKCILVQSSLVHVREYSLAQFV